MKTRKSEKIMQILGLFLLSGMVAFSVSLPVSSKTKTSSKKTSSTKKTSTSSKSKSTSSSSSSKRAATTTKKRSLSSTKRAATSSTSTKRAATSSSRTSTKRNVGRVRRTIGNSLSFLNQLGDNSTAEEQICIDKYVECMDSQITGIIGKYSFLADDEALNAALDTGQPFRCAFYDNNSNTLVASDNLLSDDKSICINSDVSNCYTQRGVNELYSSYNYYCDINRKLKNNIGRKINQCDISHGSSFATKYSIAYYNEVLNRINGDGLQMINLESSTIYKNFIEQLNLQNPDSYVISSDISNEIFSELNLDTETELFSINVVPPIGANNYLASSQFNTASNKCFVIEELSGTAAQKKLIKENNEKTTYLKNNCGPLKSNLERYYLTGKWKGVPLDEEGNQISGETTDIETGFFSAKDSCNLYEQALISVRDSKYGEFDNQMQNWIEDNIAKMIKKKIKSTSSLTQAENTLISLDQTISFDNEKLAREISYNKTKAEGDLKLAETNLSIAMSSSNIKKSEAYTELATLYVNNFSANAVAACSTMVQDAYNAICQSNGNSCFSSSALLSPYYTWTTQATSRGIKISRDGDIVPSHINNVENKDYSSYVVAKTNPTDNSVKEGYYPILCKNIGSFNYDIPLFSSIINAAKVKASFVGDEVRNDLKNQFPGKKE
ncbi:hypothetical protein HDR59_03940 [bacterium]|nr:hypothetical protein [bacterium]